MVTITKRKSAAGGNAAPSIAASSSSDNGTTNTGRVTITKRPATAVKPAAPASNPTATTASKTGSAYAPRSTIQWREVGGGRVSTTPVPIISANRRADAKSSRVEQKGHTIVKHDDIPASRILNTLKSGALSEVSNQANNIGVGYDARGGSTMAAGVYKDQALMLQQQVNAARAGLNDTTLSAMDRADLQRALKDSEDQLAIIQKATGAEKQVAPAMYHASDTAASKAEATKQSAYFGLGKVGRAAVDVGAGLTGIGMQEAANLVAPGASTVARAASLSGQYSRANRLNSPDNYDPQKAALAGTIAGAGVVAGKALSGAVSAAGLNVMRAMGKQNAVLPNILNGGVTGMAYALGETGAGEASNYATYQGYKTDPKALAENMAWAFAFGAIDTTIKTAAMTAQNKAYVQQLNSDVSKRYEIVKKIMDVGTPEQKAQGASSVMDGVEKLRAALNDMQFIGAQKQVDSINQFLNSIDAEMAQYIPVTTEAPAAAQGSLAAAPVPSPVAPEPASGEIIPAGEKAAVAPPSAVPEFTPEDYANIEVEPQEDYSEAVTPKNTIPESENPASLIPVANTLGESGKKAMMAFYDGDVDTDLYAKDFVTAYNAGLNGKTRPTENYISLGKAVAAYTAGQNDAKAKAPAPKEMTLDEAFSAFNDGGIINEEKVAQDVANGTFPQIEESAEESVPAEHTIVEEEPASGKVDKLGDTIPDTATTEKAEAALSTAIKMPIKGTNQNALLQGIVTGELSMQSVTFGNSVQGFSDEQRKSLARQIIEGRHSSGKSIKIDVPYDGQFSITNKPEAIVEVLDRLNVRAIQETIFDAQADKILKGAKKTAIFKDQNGGKYLSEGYILLPVTDAAVDYAVSNYKAYEYPFPAHMAAALESPYTPITTPPRIFQKGKNISYVFDLPNGAQRLIPKQVAQKLDGGKFYISNPANKVCFIKSVDKNGSVLGYCLTNQQPEHIDTTALQIAPGRSFTRNMLSEEAPANKPSGAAKPKTPGVQTTKNKEGNHAAVSEAVKNGTFPTTQESLPSEKQESTTKEEKPSQSSAPQQIADQVGKYITGGKDFTAARLFEIADKAYGGTMAQGTYTVKDAYDGMELAVNQSLMQSEKVKAANDSADGAVKMIRSLENVLSRLPTQSKRTEEMEKFQQFSTPPTIAYTAAWCAGITNKDVALEPSAGIGGIALWPKAWGAKVYANELSERRLAFLKQLGLDGTFNLNAEQIDNMLPENIKPTVVLMNPPFSSTAGRTASNKTSNAERHIEQALNRLEDGGRLVAVLGRGMSDDAPAFRKWWGDIKAKYNVRANIRIDGSNYHKYGTDFDIQLVVIDKNGPTKNTLTGEYKDLTEIPKVMEGIRNDRRTAEGYASDGIGSSAESQSPSAAGRGNAGGIERTDGNASVNLPGRPASGTHAAGPSKQPGRTGSAVREGNSGKDGQQVGGSSSGLSGNVHGQSERGGKLPAGSEPQSARPGAVKESTAKLDTSAAKDNTVEALEHPDSVYASYTPRKARIEGSVKHPAKLVESAAMSAVDPPDVTYTPNIPQKLIKSGALSDAQLENIIYAGQAHEQMLPNGQRKGYFIGDGTGVGKGRQISGIILDNFRQGRKRAIWISRSSNLYQDAIRDWTDLGGDKDDVISFNKVKFGQSISADTGILFSSYDTLKQEKGADSRLAMLEKWLGKDFDGVIVFDEAHTMNKAVSQKGVRGRSKPAGRALAGINLQKMFPNARVVYASATGATDVSGYAYLERLGLWGKGTAFNDVNDFIAKISDGGLAAMELVARDMKAMGAYMARSISYDDVKYDTVQHDLTPMQTKIYDTLSTAWQKVFQNIESALDTTNANKNGMARSAAWSAFYSTQQRFYNQIITSMSMPTVIEDMKKELAAGHSIVVQLVNTNQASADRAIAEAEDTGTDLDDMDLTPSDSLVQLLENSFPVQAYEEYTDDKGNTQSRPVTDKDGNPVLDRQAVRQRDALIAEVKQMKVPDGPLEMLFDEFGTEQVAEVTGRTRRVVEKPDENGHMRRVVESRSANSGLADAQMFQDGKKRILVFSDAGGTGKSYHADRRAKNQQQRIHYLLQPGWNASNATQGFGRTHRSNEVNAPVFRLVTTNIMGQKRFTSTIARRLDQLGALTKGQRQAGSGIFGEKDNLECPIAQDALERYYKTMPVDIVKKLGLYPKLYDSNGMYKPDPAISRDIGKFLNRILSLEVDEQNEVFQGFYDTFERMMDAAIASGSVDMGLENYAADKIDLVDEKVIRTDPSGADTKYVQMTAYKKPETLSYQGAITRTGFQGFVKISDGAVRAVYPISAKTNAKGEIEERYKLQSPETEKYSTYVQSTMEKETTAIPKSEWKNAWAAETKKLPEYNETRLHMLTGTLLPIWDRLPTSNTRVMRIVASDGKQYLGRLIRATDIDSVLRGLGTARTQETYTPEQISKKVMDEGKTAVLRDNKTRIVRRRVSGENRMEILGSNVWYIAQQYHGIISERINYEYRYFIPTGEQGANILSEIMKNNPVVDIRDAESSSVDHMVAAESPEQKWSAQRIGDTEKAPMPVSDIVEKIRHDFGINITTGHVRGAGVMGQYDRGSQGIRSRVVNDLPTVSHELGHHLDNLYGLTKNLPEAARRELIDGLDAEMKSAYKEKKWLTEGLAEYTRKYLQNRETAAIDYPEFTKHFKNRLNAKDNALVDQLADEVNAYYSMDAETAGSSIRNREDRGRDFRTWDQRVAEKGDAFYQAWVDSNHGIRLFDRATGSQTYKLASNAAYADAMAGSILTGDLTGPEGRYVASGLTTVLHGVDLKNKTEYRDFGEYLVVKHGPERLKEGMRIFADDRKNSTAWMEDRAQALEQQYPEFKAAAARLYQFQTDFLQTWGVGTGLVSAQSAKNWAERWKYYVPLNRFMGDRGAGGAKRGFANQNSTIRKAYGSGRDIVNPVDNIINNVVRMVNAATRNNVAAQITKVAQSKGGMADFLEKVPAPLKQKTFDTAALKEKLSDALDEGMMQGTIHADDASFAQDIIDGIDDLLIQYGRGVAHGDVVTVLRDGKPEYWKINDPMLLSSLTSMDTAKLPAWLETYGAMSRFVTSNITGNNVIWSIFSNFPRDLMTYFTFSQDKNPVHMMGGIAAAYANRLKGKNADPLYKEYLAMGGGKVSAYSADRDLTKNIRAKLTGGKAQWLNPVEWICFVSDTVEMGPRYSYYKICREKLGMTPQEAFYESCDITVNFRRGGVQGRTINKVIPFFNAGVQGLDKFARWATCEEIPYSISSKERSKAIRGRMAAYLTASAALAAIFYGMNAKTREDRDNYAQLSNYTKNSYWCIPLGGGNYFTIPKPREIAVISSFMETSAERYVSGNKHAFDDFYGYAADTCLPNVASDLAQADIGGAIGNLGVLGTGVRMFANKDFLGKPIVSSGMQNLEPKDQYNNRTSKLAKAMGDAFNVSPMMTDYFFSNTLGGWWKYQKALFPVGSENVDLTLGVQGSYVRDNQYSTDLVNWLYDQAAESNTRRNSNPEDMVAAIQYKRDSSMTSFYSNFNKLSKSAPETESRRETRQAVLSMITEYRKDFDNGTRTEAEAAVEAVCEAAGNTEYLPAVMPVTVKDANGEAHTLSDAQYLEYQTEYLGFYWDTVERTLDRAGNPQSKESVLAAAKSVAKDNATRRLFSRMGIKAKPDEYKGIGGSTLTQFKAGIDKANDDGSLTQEEVIDIIDQMNGLSDDQRSTLFRSHYKSDKNNPWA